jgi:hypothetical protein
MDPAVKTKKRKRRKPRRYFMEKAAPETQPALASAVSEDCANKAEAD